MDVDYVADFRLMDVTSSDVATSGCYTFGMFHLWDGSTSARAATTSEVSPSEVSPSGSYTFGHFSFGRLQKLWKV